MIEHDTKQRRFRRLLEATTATVVGSSKQITVPVGAVFHVLASQDNTLVTVVSPANLGGTTVRLHSQDIATADDVKSEHAGADEKPVRSQEQIVHHLQYKESIQHCLNKILDWENLPAVDAVSFAHGIRDLGHVTDYVDTHIATSPKRMRAWIHHVNMAIESPSLTVELAQFPNRDRHLVLVLTTTW